MADDDEVLPDEGTSDDGAQGEGAEGQDTGAGDEDSEVSPVSSDAPPEGDDGPQDGQPEGDRPVSRGANRFQRLSNDNAALREELAAARREREADRQRQVAQQQQWTEQQQQERWAVMTPEEKVEELRYWGQQQLQSLQQQNAFQMGLLRDQMQYDAKATVNPVYARHKVEVERQYQEHMQQGRHIPRETLLYQMLGRRAVETAATSTRKAKVQGQKKIEAQTTRPSSNKGDAASSRGKSGDSAEKRLAGVEI